MSIDPDELAEAVATGETERVDDAIDRVTAADPTDRFAWYDDLIVGCQPVFANGDGYVRQSVVRLLRAAYPGLEMRLGDVDAAPVEGVHLTDTEPQRHRYVEFLLEALDDDDERVRTAATDGIDDLANAMTAAELEIEQEALHDALSTLAVGQPEEKRQHTERAMRMVGRPGVDAALSELSRRIDHEE